MAATIINTATGQCTISNGKGQHRDRVEMTKRTAFLGPFIAFRFSMPTAIERQHLMPTTIEIAAVVATSMLPLFHEGGLRKRLLEVHRWIFSGRRRSERWRRATGRARSARRKRVG